MKKLIIAGIGILCLSSVARADWEGNFTITVPANDQTGQMTGMMRAKGTKTRVDVQTPMVISTIVDTKTHKAFSLMHSQKMVMESDFTKAQQGQPVCIGSDVDACFKQQGFKKVGSETIGKHPCDIYEGTPKDSKGKVKVWRPRDMKEVPAVKTITQDEQGRELVIEFQNLKMAAQADSHFTVPAGYKTMGMPQFGKPQMPGVKAPEVNKPKAPEVNSEEMMKKLKGSIKIPSFGQ